METRSRYTEELCASEARDAGLRYVTDDMPGIRRRKAGKGFAYYAPEGERVTRPDVLERIRLLAIPPAYQGVWICPLKNGHLQATGRDAKGRKQYRYHPNWMDYRNATKFEHLAQFGSFLPLIRETVDADLRGRILTARRVLALTVALLDETGMRVGNDAYARENNTYGLTTLRKRHVSIEGHKVRFEFTGKRGKRWCTTLRNPRLARHLRRCEELPGQMLFQYHDESGEQRRISSEDINAYLRETTGEPFTAKDFRTWNATRLAIAHLLECPLAPEESDTARQKRLTATVREVARQMGHTPAICRKSYIAPRVLEWFPDGRLHRHFDAETLEDEAIVAFLQG